MLPEQNKKIPLSFIIDESIHGNTRMQKLLYQRYAASMYYICLRYVKTKANAEDVLQEGFIKVFRNLGTFKNEGSFEGWIKKIMTRTALTYLRDNKRFSVDTILENSVPGIDNNVLDELAKKDIIDLITKLPTGSKKIFMLYVLEGYNHRQIAEILGCTEGTSKSQFYRSRTRIQKQLMQSV